MNAAKIVIFLFLMSKLATAGERNAVDASEDMDVYCVYAKPNPIRIPSVEILGDPPLCAAHLLNTCSTYNILCFMMHFLHSSL